MTDRDSRRGDNEIFLRGTVAADPEVRTLPSGDELCSFRLTVQRPSGSRVRVDSIDCSATDARARRLTQRYVAGDVVEVTGSLHRRFWRTATGAPASRYEVDVASARRVSSGRRTGDKPARMRASA